MKQIANVAALPGIVGHSVGLPDVHSGYGFAIGFTSNDFLNICLDKEFPSGFLDISFES